MPRRNGVRARLRGDVGFVRRFGRTHDRFVDVIHHRANEHRRRNSSVDGNLRCERCERSDWFEHGRVDGFCGHDDNSP